MKSDVFKEPVHAACYPRYHEDPALMEPPSRWLLRLAMLQKHRTLGYPRSTAPEPAPKRSRCWGKGKTANHPHEVDTSISQSGFRMLVQQRPALRHVQGVRER